MGVFFYQYSNLIGFQRNHVYDHMCKQYYIYRRLFFAQILYSDWSIRF